MDDYLSGFAALKRSALSKSKIVNPYVDRVTIGPNSRSPEPVITAVLVEKKPKQYARENAAQKTQYAFNEPIKLILDDMEIQRKEKVQEAITNRRKKWIEAKESQETQQREKWNRQQNNMFDQMQQQEFDILRALQQHDIDSSKKREKVKQYYQQLAERKLRNDNAIREKEERHQQINKIIDTVSKAQFQFKHFYLEIIQCLGDCSEHVKESLKECIESFKLLHVQIEEIVNRCKAGTVGEADSVKCVELLQLAKKYKEEIATKIINENQQQEIKLAQSKVVAKEVVQVVQKPVVKVEASKKTLDSCVGNTSFKSYSELQTLLKRHEDGFKSLLEDVSMKNFKFDCKKAVNIPVNALSTVHSDNLIDKYNKLHTLLAGKSVKIANMQINASNHPQGIAFCMDLLSRKFILQGDLMISSNPEAAFGYSAIIVALWNDFPVFGNIVLAHFQRECPYLVPIYLPRNAQQSDEEYYVSIGYHYNDGTVEDHDKFLKRMTGIFRLYFSILISRPKRGQDKNPHDITIGWRWITNVLNLEPRMDITATALHVFFEVAGSAMEKAYGKQFIKLVDYICSDYMKLMQAIDTGGSVVRLQLFLDEYRKSGRLEDPSGMLPNNFW